MPRNRAQAAWDEEAAALEPPPIAAVGNGSPLSTLGVHRIAQRSGRRLFRDDGLGFEQSGIGMHDLIDQVVASLEPAFFSRAYNGNSGEGRRREGAQVPVEMPSSRGG